MIIDRDLFLPLFEEVRRVRETLETYCLAGDAIPLPKDNIQYAIEQEYDVKIDVYMVPLDSNLLHGEIDIYDERSVIYIDSYLNSAWVRYVFTKEACHHLLRNAEFKTDDPIKVIEHFVLDEKEIDGMAVAALDVQAEILTKFAAIELLFPYEMRLICKQEVEAGEKTNYEISEYFDIPENLVQFALGNLYMNFAKGIWDELN